TVTGTGTNFSANCRVGDAFLGPDGNWYEVTNIPSSTVLSILPAYKGATVAGGSYSVTPVQGYDKNLRDAINAVVQQWGGALAGLGSVSTENVVPVAKGGTGGTTQATARNGLGLKAAAVADIVGAVSQSGGVPTGAIIERGSNANGDYTKYADGSMICRGLTPQQPCSTALSGGSGLFYNATPSIGSFAAAFSSIPRVAASAVRVSASDGASTMITGSEVAAGTVSSSPQYRGVSHISGSIIQFSYVAVGRWFE
uniref:phage tail protein n=1 Tax=Pseudomonas putida TaxID=303 RepID=UPI0018C25CE6